MYSYEFKVHTHKLFQVPVAGLIIRFLLIERHGSMRLTVGDVQMCIKCRIESIVFFFIR